MRSTSWLPVLFFAAALPARAQKQLTESLGPTVTGPQLPCDSVRPPDKKKQPRDRSVVCSDESAAASGDFENSNCDKYFWRYLVASCYTGEGGFVLCNDARVKRAPGSDPAKKVKAAWKSLGTDRAEYVSKTLDRYTKEINQDGDLLNAEIDARDACKAFNTATGDRSAQGQDLSSKVDAYKKSFGDLSTPNGTQGAPDNWPYSALKRLSYAFAPMNDGDEQFHYNAMANANQAISGWVDTLKSQQFQAQDQQARAQQAAAAGAAAAGKRLDSIRDYRQKLDQWSKDDPQNVTRELRAAFDQAGLSSVKVGETTRGADGTIIMDIAISQEDYSKLSDAQKAKLQAMGIQPPPPGMKMEPFTFATPQQKQRIDYFEQVLFSTDPKAKLALDSVGKAIPDASGKDWAKAALGSGLGGLAESPHGQAQVQDKINAARSKAAAEYADADAQALKKCQDNHDQLVKMGLDPKAGDQKCSQSRMDALTAYHQRLDAVADQQSHADQLSAAANTQRLNAYKKVLGEKRAANLNRFGFNSNEAYWSKHASYGTDMANHQKAAQAAYTALDNEIQREGRSVDAALAKMPDVTTGKAPMSSVRDLDPSFLPKVFTTDGNAYEVYDAVLGDKQKAFEKALPDPNK